jgi:hypothetical protein
MGSLRVTSLAVAVRHVVITQKAILHEFHVATVSLIAKLFKVERKISERIVKFFVGPILFLVH